MTALVYGQNRTITEATTIRTIRMDRTDTIISIGALTTFRRTGITDIISTAGGTAGIVAKIGVRMTSKIPGCFRLTSQSGPEMLMIMEPQTSLLEPAHWTQLPVKRGR
jgi:hypothetical protein